MRIPPELLQCRQEYKRLGTFARRESRECPHPRIKREKNLTFCARETLFSTPFDYGGVIMISYVWETNAQDLSLIHI